MGLMFIGSMWWIFAPSEEDKQKELQSQGFNTEMPLADGTEIIGDKTKAYELGNATFAGIILLGKLIEETKIVAPENFEKALYKILPPKKHGLIPAEMEALKFGAEF
jgi:hypothetical protein